MESYPYNDDFMIFDEELGQYVLTENALLSRGINLRARLSARKDVTPEAIISNIAYTSSAMIYGFIHQYNDDNPLQDFLIAKCADLRKIIYEALLSQAIYVCVNGNLFLSTDDNERKKAIDENAVFCLQKTVKSLGNRSILFCGNWHRYITWRETV